MSDQNDEVLEELQKFLDPNLERASPPQPMAVELDDSTIDLARQAARPPWYASWATGAVLLAGPMLVLMAGIFGGQESVIGLGVLSFLFLFSCGSVLVLIWFASFLGHRSRAKSIRQAITLRRAWSLTGQVGGVDRIITIDNQPLITRHRTRIPDWARTGACTAVFIEANVPMVIKITGPDGGVIYPATGFIPEIVQLPAVIASILIGLAFTAACNAQSRTYNDAAARLHDIEAASQCTTQSGPGDDCWKWVAGTVEKTGVISSVSGASPGPVSSSCFVVLRWENANQEGRIRTEGADCNEQLAKSTFSSMPASIQVLRDYAIQVRVGDTNYRTDRWPPYGDTVFSLTLIFRMATILWLVWPIVHVATAVVYRVRRAISGSAVGPPSSPARRAV